MVSFATNGSVGFLDVAAAPNLALPGWASLGRVSTETQSRPLYSLELRARGAVVPGPR